MSASTIAPLAISVSIGLAVMTAVAAFGMFRSPAARARGRVQALMVESSPYAVAEGDTVRLNRSRRFGRFTESLGRSANERTQLALQRSGFPLRVGEYIAIRLLAVGGGALVLAALFGVSGGSTGALLGALGGLALGFIAPPAVLGVAARRREKAIESQLVELCEMMASMMRSGYGYVQALAATAAEVGDPLGSELTKLVDAVRLGGNVDEELDELNKRLGSHDFDMIATAVMIQRKSGGNLAEILEGVAETVRYRQSFRRDLSALTARERFSAIIVAGIPVVLVASLSAMDPARYQLLFTDPLGRLLLGVAIALDVTGYVVIKQVSKVEV